MDRLGARSAVVPIFMGQGVLVALERLGRPVLISRPWRRVMVKGCCVKGDGD